ncbi:S-adenosyl-L-methionine-dependent methyltransferase [Poronia punctata]|nr:S-adenosyl-L-methionine-dependent methyltransferase [Poronia punctata]
MASYSSLIDLIDQVTSKVKGGISPEDEPYRRRLGQAALRLSQAMEEPHDTVHRLGNAPFQTALAHVGIEKGIFKAIAKREGNHVTNETLAQETNIHPSLMNRLLRYYQSMGMAAQHGPDRYGPTITTKNLTSPICDTGVSFYFRVLSPAFIAVPQLLSEINYDNVVDPNHCAWHIGRNTDEAPWKYLQSRPELARVVSNWMAVQREGLPCFLDAMDFAETNSDTDESTPLLVDMGGGMGSQCIVFRQRCPHLPGRVILQEQQHVIDQVASDPLPGFRELGVEAQVHDLFEKQPVQGARAYYMRNVLHDFTDDACVQILQNIQPSMSEDSVILVDEMVLSDYGVPSRAAQMDMAMLTCLAAKERSEEEWKELFDRAGFKIINMYRYSPEFQDAVQVIVPK